MDIIAQLSEALGPGAVLAGAEVRSRSAGIWRRDGLQAKAVLRPTSTEQVSRALAICHRRRQSVVAHGGLTGLVDGAFAAPDDIVLSLERMNAIEEIDALDRTAVVQSGVILQTLQEAADAKGLFYPQDLGGRGSCTIGGNIATNAGGNRVIRYGMTRDMVLGLEAVLADGTLVSSMNRMLKNNAGYDLKQLFMGTEGTLGIVTRAVLRLREKPRAQTTVLAAVDEFGKLGALLKAMDAASGGGLSAFEALWNNFYLVVTSPPAKTRPPLSQKHPYYALLEVAGADESAVEAALAQASEKGLVAEAVLAQSEAQRLRLWGMRDDVEQCFQFGPIFTFDVSMRISRMEAYVAEVNRRLQRAFGSVRNFTFGHLGDGNLHFVICVGDGGRESRAKVESCVYEPLAPIAGSVSGEHGVGLEKKPYLGLCRSPAELELMRALKRTLDPKGILNPGKVFDV